ncbi:MAG: serine/threonine-protein kinase, partial [Gammaproteobacteria bacterium]
IRNHVRQAQPEMTDHTETNVASTRIGKYLIRRLLGRGAMGVVYEGYDEDIDRRVAIKSVHPALIAEDSGGEFLARFKREAQAAARCMHPNIVTVLEYGQHEGAPYLVMEYVQGTTLSARLKTGQPLGLKQALSILSHLLNALNVAHANHVIHRDIKPGNIMLMPDGTAKLADFGLARLQMEQDLTQAGIALGTPRFMAPEQYFGQPTDGRADLFSTTVVLLDLLKAVPVEAMGGTEPLPRFNELPANVRIDPQQQVPSALIPLIQAGLAVNPEDRVANVKQYATLLRQAVSGMRSGLNKVPQAAAVVQQALNTGPEPSIDSTQFDDPSRYLAERGELSGMGSGSAGSSGRRSGQLFTGFAAAIDEDTFTRLKSDYSGLVGSEGSRKVRQEAEEAISFAELIHALANAIDDRRKRKRFLRDWEPG